MPTIELTDDEMVTLRDAFDDVGNDCSGVDWDKLKALGVKLGFWEAEQPPTAEEIARREAYLSDPLVKQCQEMFKRISDNLFEKYAKDIEYYDGSRWPVGGQLRIRLPNDYQVKDKNILHKDKK